MRTRATCPVPAVPSGSNDGQADTTIVVTVVVVAVIVIAALVFVVTLSVRRHHRRWKENKHQRMQDPLEPIEVVEIGLQRHDEPYSNVGLQHSDEHYSNVGLQHHDQPYPDVADPGDKIELDVMPAVRSRSLCHSHSAL
eukprot:TRINITY_DN6587_c0_g2_i1.p3 TRINITY_DN6587_c0_g2~~TRINITY_DN6587_c0_g2_i1.p3  ORF type:complete len:139 (+),score=37.53 TRINITY_DN6587_c0_g2_i1:196-612(+)